MFGGAVDAVGHIDVTARLGRGINTDVVVLVFGDDTFEHVDRPDEPGHEAGVGELVDFLGFTDLGDLAVVHHPDAGRERHGFFLIVGDHDEGHAEAFLDLDQFVLCFLAQLLVERAQRFIEQEQFGALGQRPGKGDALTLAAGKLMRLAPGKGLKAGEL